MVDYRTSNRTGGNRDSTLGGNKQNLMCIRIQGKGEVTSQETEPELFSSVGSVGCQWLAMGMETLAAAVLGDAPWCESGKPRNDIDSHIF